MFTLLLAGITTSVLTTPLAIGLGQGDRITRPTVSEKVSPLEPIAPLAHDGYRGRIEVPDWKAHRAMLHAKSDLLLRRRLQKNRRHRQHDNR